MHSLKCTLKIHLWKMQFQKFPFKKTLSNLNSIQWIHPHLKNKKNWQIKCYRHTCVLPNHQFYFYILAVSSALLCIYILCNLYNLVRFKKNCIYICIYILCNLYNLVRVKNICIYICIYICILHPLQSL